MNPHSNSQAETNVDAEEVSKLPLSSHHLSHTAQPQSLDTDRNTQSSESQSHHY